MKAVQFLNEFKSIDDVIKQYEAPADALKGAEVRLAWYGYGSYCGESLVVFEHKGKLYEVNGSHCSCNGLEGQWKPEETTWEAIRARADANIKRNYHECDGEVEAAIKLRDICDRQITRLAKSKMKVQ